MAHSRFSIPLFAIGLLAVAACMIYLVATKNIFGFTSLSSSDTTEGARYSESALYADESAVRAESGKGSENLFLDMKKIKKVIASGAKKITGTPAVEGAEASKADVANSGGEQAVAEASGSTTENNSEIILGSVQSTALPRDYQLKVLWRKYNETIPRLYAHPRDENTEEILARVGQIAMEFELGYKGQFESELIKIAAAGEREGARALSFQYAKSSTVESLAWAMIANAIAENDYYLYVCTEEYTSCSENLFAQAEAKAKTYIGAHHFLPAQ